MKSDKLVVSWEGDGWVKRAQNFHQKPEVNGELIQLTKALKLCHVHNCT